MKREATPAKPAAPTPEQAISAMKDFTNAQNRIAAINAKKAHKKQTIDEQNADDIANCEEVIKTAKERLEQYAIANPQLFEDKRSIDLLYGTIGYSKNPAKIEVEEGHKEEDVVTTLRSNAKFVGFITTKYSLNKTAIKAALNADKKLAEQLGKLHISVAETESFFIKPKAA